MGKVQLNLYAKTTGGWNIGVLLERRYIVKDYLWLISVYMTCQNGGLQVKNMFLISGIYSYVVISTDWAVYMPIMYI